MIARVQPTIDTIAPQNISRTEKGRLTREQFLKLLTTQLQQQDPTDPMDNGKILEQLSLLENLEATGSLTKTLQGMVQSSTLGSAANLLGKHVSAFDGEGKRIEGIVSGLTAGREGVRLTVDGRKVALEQIREIRNPTEGETAA